jgi:AAA+ superfamily predicted ATPase
MSSTPSTEKYLDALPAWARELSEKYYSRSYSLFVLYGNVRDLVPFRQPGVPVEPGSGPVGGKPAGTQFLSLDQFLSGALFGQRDIVLHYDRGGLSFGSADSQSDFRRALEGYDSFHGTSFAQGGLPRNPDAVLNILDNYLRLRTADGKKIALVIDFAETIAPAGDVSSMSAEDRNSLVIFKRWARNPDFLNADVTICLVSENQIELNQGIVQNPGVASIEIPLPDERERLDFVRWQVGSHPLPQGSEVTAELLAKLGAGLKRVQLQSLVAHAVQNKQPFTLKFINERKKELIESESGGLLEFIQSRFDLSYVAGNDMAKQKLKDAAAAIRLGNTDVLPMGYVICGPVGTGKTFITTCFAGEVGIPAVTLKNFRSMWQGVTEGNLERVLNLLKAMSPIAVIVDEADAQLGDRSSSGDSGVSNRVFAQIAQFMGNTEYRGKVIWFLLTCRPDLLPVDLKRQGRAEEHIALFYPETLEERRALLRAMQKKAGMAAFTPEMEQFFLDNSGSLSGADIEAVLVRSRMRAALDKRASVAEADLKGALEDFIPPSYPTEIDLQNLVAVLECTSKSLLPKKYRDADRGEMMRRANELLALSRQSGEG